MLRRISTYLGLLVALSFVFGHTEARKPGGKFTVYKKDFRPDVAGLNDGGFVAIWRGDSPYRVKAQRYNAKVKKGGKVF